MVELEKLIEEMGGEKDSFLSNVSDKEFSDSIKKLEESLEKKFEEIEIAKENSIKAALREEFYIKNNEIM